MSSTTLLPVDVVDMPLENPANHHAASSSAVPLSGVIEVQIGKAFVKIDAPVDTQVLRTVLESLR
ncbi:IS66 family insertion sequence element accessory protein TnpB [Burkholderia ambifaria]|uniref:IS66 family insertion sequence element accessory protein TnpB n=1 Tax=Burkholderia ambifaria TaxID=152480 RepID=UPI0018E07E48|nr:IS66 family insertion sequence element accessory protein TnpB [Burkholderia ambifaria]